MLLIRNLTEPNVLFHRVGKIGRSFKFMLFDEFLAPLKLRIPQLEMKMVEEI